MILLFNLLSLSLHHRFSLQILSPWIPLTQSPPQIKKGIKGIKRTAPVATSTIRQNYQLFKDMSARNQQQFSNMSGQLQAGLQDLQQWKASIGDIIKSLVDRPTPPTSTQLDDTAFQPTVTTAPTQAQSPWIPLRPPVKSKKG